MAYKTSKIEAFGKIIRILKMNHLPIIKGLDMVIKDKKAKKFSYRFMANTNYVVKKDSYMEFDEYISLGMRLNDFSFCDFLNNKYNQFKRYPQFMGRRCIDIRKASDDEITEFINNNEKFVGKIGAAGGVGFKVYNKNMPDILSKIRLDEIEYLEEYIVQHDEFSQMNPTSVNTIRIHTIRTTTGCIVYFYPKVRIGKLGAVLDISWENNNESYRLLLDHKGAIQSGFIQTDMIYQCNTHLGTKYRFEKGKILPFISEAEQLCIAVAEKVPEFRYIGWDVAITPKGPIIVEGNVLSGAWGNTLEVISYYMDAEGARRKKEKIFNIGMEGIICDCNKLFKAKSFADLSYLENADATPNALQQFLVLLQSTLHNYGIDFFGITDSIVNCSIVFEKESEKIIVNNTEEFDLPTDISENIYEADKQARNLAKMIYDVLR